MNLKEFLIRIIVRGNCLGLPGLPGCTVCPIGRGPFLSDMFKMHCKGWEYSKENAVKLFLEHYSKEELMEVLL